jgi:hypothetical protein
MITVGYAAIKFKHKKMDGVLMQSPETPKPEPRYPATNKPPIVGPHATPDDTAVAPDESFPRRIFLNFALFVRRVFYNYNFLNHWLADC